MDSIRCVHAAVNAVKSLSRSKIFEFIILYPEENCNIALDKAKYVS